MPFTTILKPLLLRLYNNHLNPGGVLAFQIPDSPQQPSHVAIENVAPQFLSLQNICVPWNEVNMKEYFMLFNNY